MRLLVSGATAALRRHAHPHSLGTLVVPHAGNRLDAVLTPGVPWAADNAAFSGFDAPAFLALLAKLAGRPDCRFVACPDVVGDAAATLTSFALWQPLVTSLGLPVALVAQDGLTGQAVPWDRIEALFVGGSTDWKVGERAAELVREAKRRGLWVHFGRVNTRKRFRHAFRLGCDSVDGSGFSRWPDQRIPMALRWLAELHGDPLPEQRTGRFFAAGGHRLLAARGLAVTAVAETPAGFVVEAERRQEPAVCPKCQSADPAYRHGSKPAVVRGALPDGTPVRVDVRRGRFRCRACRHVFAVPLTAGRVGVSR
jgi:hypothetical protein